MKPSRTLTLLLPVLAAAAPVILEEKSAAVGREWRIIEQAPGHHLLELHLALASQNRDLFEQHALEIADPASPRWRQHMTPSEISAYLTPSDADVATVMDWLATEGVEGRQSHDMIIAMATVDQAERLLDTKYSMYEHSYGKRAIRTDRYSVPEQIRRRIDFVSPTVHFPEISNRAGSAHRRALARRAAAAGEISSGGTQPLIKIPLTNITHHANSPLVGPCGNGTFPHNTTNPTCVRAAYSIDWTVSNPNTSWSVFNPDGGVWLQSNLQQYLEIYNPKAAAAHPTFELYNLTGWVPPAVYTYDGRTETDGELDLDTQMTMGLAWPGKGIILQGNDTGIYGNFSSYVPASAQAAGQDEFVKFLHGMAYNETVPPVVSLSAGSNEDTVPYSYAQRACSLMGAAAARGVTFVFSSGDTGPVAQARIQHNLTVDPQWPAACPWVLAVGATTNPFNETAATMPAGAGFTSGGGFSNYFARPSWQDASVPAYIEQHVDAGFQQLSGFNASGRGYPDVAAFGSDVPTFSSGLAEGEGGTSASAPLWAAFITLLNDYEASRGKPTLGFVNPWLYSLKNGEMRDITVGTGLGYGESLFFPMGPYPSVGYNATTGWDALTGLGVPVFDKLRKALP